MAQRAAASASITLNLINIPIKLYLTASSNQVRFNLISPKGNRVKQQLIDAETEEIVPREETRQGYEYQKGQYVVFTKDELEAIRSDKKNTIEIQEFVPDDLSSIRVEKSYYVAADKNSDMAYNLLHAAMKSKNQIAIGTWYVRGRDHLIALRAGDNRTLVMHQLYYDKEMRSIGEPSSNMTFSDEDLAMAQALIETKSRNEFDLSRYFDGYGNAVNQAVQRKIDGKEITAVGEMSGSIGDLFEQLRNSLKQEGYEMSASVKKKASSKRPAKKAKRPSKAKSG